MQVTIGIKHASRELSLETSDSQEKVLAAVADAVRVVNSCKAPKKLNTRAKATRSALSRLLFNATIKYSCRWA